MDRRSGFRKRSKVRPYSSGSTSVMSDAVGGHGPRRRAAHAEEDALAPGEVGEVADDQKILAEAGLLDDVQFKAQALLVLGRDDGVAALHALKREFGEIRLRVHALGRVAGRGHGEAPELQIQVAAVGDLAGPGQGVGVVRGTSAYISCWDFRKNCCDP